VSVLKAIGKRLYAGWMKFAWLLGTVNRYILMTVFYWVVIDLVNVGLRVLRVDLLDRRIRRQPSYWHPKPAQEPTYKHQF
jgi:hypothetical protein